METVSVSRGCGRERIRATASRTVSPSFANNAEPLAPVRAENSLGRSRSSDRAPMPERIHCRTFPSRCSSKLPTAFSLSESRAQSDGGGSSVTQVSMRSKFSASLSAAVVRKSASSVIHVSVEGSHARLTPSSRLHDPATAELHRSALAMSAASSGHEELSSYTHTELGCSSALGFELLQ